MNVRGFTLVEAVVALALATSVAVIAAHLLAVFARASLVHPRVADEQQRQRTALDQLTNWLSAAGQGLGGEGANEGRLIVPALYPQRRGVSGRDADTSAFSDRITIVAGSDPPAAAALGTAMVTPADALRLALGSCAPGRAGCGFSSGASALVANAVGVSEWFDVTRSTSNVLEHVPAVLSHAYSPADGTLVTAVETRGLWHDAPRRQLRVGTSGVDLPFIDGVAEFAVTWFGDPRAPRSPRPPAGQANCVLDQDATPRLTSLSAGAGPWAELPVAAFTDGPWCGRAPWRFDADLFRVRLVRVTLRLDDAQLAVRGPGVAPRTMSFDVAPRNLLRQ